jgi:hypothetical protein
VEDEVNEVNQVNEVWEVKGTRHKALVEDGVNEVKNSEFRILDSGFWILNSEF